MELPPGPRAPALWQTVASKARPGAFLQEVHEAVRRSGHDQGGADAAVRASRRGAGRVPAGSGRRARGTELGFLRPFAGPYSILLAELAERELAAWSGRVCALERIRQLTLEVILRVVFVARSDPLILGDGDAGGAPGRLAPDDPPRPA